MAEEISAGTVKIDFEANLRGLSDGFAQMHRELGSLGKAIDSKSSSASQSFVAMGESVRASLSSMGNNLIAVGGTLTQTLSAAMLPLAGLSAMAVQTAIKFESSFAGVRKTVEATDEEFKILEKQFRELAKTIPVTTDELNRIGETAGQLGIAKDSVLSFTKTVAAMAVTTNLSADAAANAFARIGNIMSVSSSDYARLGSTIVDLGNKGASTEAQIVNMSLRIAGAARTAGISTPAMLGLAASLSNVGIRAEAGGTAMSKLIMDIAGAVSSGGDRLAQFAAIAGQSSAQFARAFKEDGASAIAAFIQGLGAIQQKGGDLFGTLDELGIKEIRLRDAILRSASASEQFTQTLVTAKSAWAENTALGAEAEKRYQTTASQLTVLKNKLNDVSLTLGQALLPMFIKVLQAMNPLIEMVASMANAFAGLDPTTQQIIVTIGGIALAVGPVLVALGAMVMGIGALIPVVTQVGVAFSALSVLLMANPWIAIATAIAAAAVAIIMNWDKIKSGTIAAWEATKQAVFSSVKAIYDGMILWLVEKSQSIANKVQGVANAIAKPFEWLADHLVGHSVIPDMVDDIGKQMQMLDIKMTAPARNAAVQTGKVFEGLALTSESAMSQIVSTINFSYGSAVQTVSQALARMTTETQNWATIGIQIAQAFLGNMINIFIQLLTQWILTKAGMAGADSAYEQTRTAIFSAGEVARLGIAKGTNGLIAASTVMALGGMVAVGTGAVAIMVAVMEAASAMMAAIAGALAMGVVTAPLAPPVVAASGALAVGGATMGAAAFGAIQAAAGSALVAASLSAFAKGGIVTGPTLGMMGEAGSPEAAIPLNDRGAKFMANMLGLDGLSGGKGDVTVNVINAPADSKPQVNVRREMEGMVVDIILRNIASNGPLRGAMAGA